MACVKFESDGTEVKKNYPQNVALSHFDCKSSKHQLFVYFYFLFHFCLEKDVDTTTDEQIIQCVIMC